MARLPGAALKYGIRAGFCMAYAVGPGVVVWLMLSELMPTRIWSTGMGIALLLNQDVSTLIASVFLPVMGNYVYTAMYFSWAACTVLYHATARWWLPETKGRSLEEIEMFFENKEVQETALSWYAAGTSPPAPRVGVVPRIGIVQPGQFAGDRLRRGEMLGVLGLIGYFGMVSSV